VSDGGEVVDVVESSGVEKVVEAVVAVSVVANGVAKG